MSKTISDELFTALISYHLGDNKAPAQEDRIKSLLSQKINDIANRNKYRQAHNLAPKHPIE